MIDFSRPRVGILTFHGSHNYGAVLQAFALKEVLRELGGEVRIINFRSRAQRKANRPNFIKSGGGLAGAPFYPGITLGQIKKYRLFEQFIKDRLDHTYHKYTDESELDEEDLGFDVYIAGSDQIWNTSSPDHSKAYFLDFVKHARKVAYAPSCGPHPYQKSGLDRRPDLVDCIKAIDFLSVREQDAANFLESLGVQRPPVMLDPTVLLTPERWRKLIAPEPKISGDYILMYTPYYDASLYRDALELGAKFNLPVYTTISYGLGRMWTRQGMKYVVDAGPSEFLNLVANAKAVVSGSFHGVIFAILLGTPFYAPAAESDSRLRQILTLTGLIDLARDPASLADSDRWSKALSEAREKLQPEITRSREYLREGLRGL